MARFTAAGIASFVRRWARSPATSGKWNLPPGSIGDSPTPSDLSDLSVQIPADDEIGTVTSDGGRGTGDGTFEIRHCHTAILDRGGTAIIPMRINGCLWKENPAAAKARDDILPATRRFSRAQDRVGLLEEALPNMRGLIRIRPISASWHLNSCHLRHRSVALPAINHETCLWQALDVSWLSETQLRSLPRSQFPLIT